MADNQIVPVLGERNEENFTNRSRGFDRNALGTLFTGTARALGDIVESKDRAVKYEIGEEIRGAVAAMNESQLGLTRDVTVDRPPSESIPEDLKRELRSIEKSKQKWVRGKLTDTQRATQAHVIAKRLKSLWPGYSGEIDREFERHGFNPASTILRNNIAEARRSQGAATESTKYQYQQDAMLARKALDEGWLDPELANVVARNFWKVPGNSEIMGQIRQAQVTHSSRNYIRNEEAARIDQENKRGQFTAKKSAEHANVVMYDLVNNRLRKLDTYGVYQRAATRLQQEGGRGEPSPQAIQQFNEAATALVAELDNEFNLLISGQHPQFSRKTSDVIRNLRAQDPKAYTEAVEIYNNFKQAIVDAANSGDIGLVKRTLNTMDQMSTARGGDILRQSRELQTLKDMSTQIDPRILNHNMIMGRVLPSAVEAFNTRQTADILRNPGQVRSTEEHLARVKDRAEAQGMPEEQQRMAVDAQTGMFVSIIKNPGRSAPESIREAHRLVFGRDNYGMLARFGQERRVQLYRELTSPEAQRTVKRLVDEGVLDQSHLQNMQAWAAQAFNRVNQASFAEASSFNQSSTHQVYFNQDTNKFEVRQNTAVIAERDQRQRTNPTTNTPFSRDVTAERATARERLMREDMARAQEYANRFNADFKPVVDMAGDTGVAPELGVIPTGIPIISTRDAEVGPGGVTGPGGPPGEQRPDELGELLRQVDFDPELGVSQAIPRTLRDANTALSVARYGLEKTNPGLGSTLVDMAINAPEQMTEAQVNDLARGYAENIGSARMRMMRNAVIAADMGNMDEYNRLIGKIDSAPPDAEDLTMLREAFKRWWKEEYINKE